MKSRKTRNVYLNIIQTLPILCLAWNPYHCSLSIFNFCFFLNRQLKLQEKRILTERWIVAVFYADEKSYTVHLVKLWNGLYVEISFLTEAFIFICFQIWLVCFLTFLSLRLEMLCTQYYTKKFLVYMCVVPAKRKSTHTHMQITWWRTHKCIIL